jgi:hypothetical protein
MPDFRHNETDMATRLGIPREALRQARQAHLREDEDWVKKGGQVHLTDAAYATLLQKLGLPSELPPPPKNVARCILHARPSAHGLNRMIVEATLPGGDPRDPRQLLRVRVKDRTNFRYPGADGKPMELPCVHLGGDLFEMVNKRCPRWPGKW